MLEAEMGLVPMEAKAAMGDAVPASAEDTARAYLRGIDRGLDHIYPSFRAAMVGFAGHYLSPVVRWVFARKIKQARAR